MNSIISFVPGTPNRFTSNRAKYLSTRTHLRLRNSILLLNAETRKLTDTVQRDRQALQTCCLHIQHFYPQGDSTLIWRYLAAKATKVHGVTSLPDMELSDSVQIFSAHIWQCLIVTGISYWRVCNIE